jgi:hypothetical protein
MKLDKVNEKTGDYFYLFSGELRTGDNFVMGSFTVCTLEMLLDNKNEEIEKAGICDTHERERERERERGGERGGEREREGRDMHTGFW